MFQVSPPSVVLDSTGETRTAHDVKQAAEEMERRALTKALDEARNNLSEAARRLGIGRGALRYRLERLGIAPRER